jgi:putative MATE family efflux protein
VKTSTTYSEIIKMAYPIMLGNLSMTFVGMADTMMMGRLGHAQMDATGYSGLFIFIMTMIGYSFCKGFLIMTAQYDGAGEQEKVGKYFYNSLILLGTLGVIFFIVFHYFANRILGILINDAEVLKYSIEFTQMRSWSYLYINLSFLCSSFYMGIGKTKILLYVMLVSSILNVIFIFILSFGHFGFPAMGVSGCAMASNIAEFVGVIFYFIGLYLDRNKIVVFGLFQSLSLDWSVLKNIFNISLPLVLQHLVSLGTWLVFFTWIETLGSKALAVSMILKSIYMMISIPGFSLASVANTLVSNLIGKRAFDEIEGTIWKIVVVNCVVLFTITFITYLIQDPWIAYYSKEMDIVIETQNTIWILLIVMLLFPFGNTFFQSVVSLGNTYRSLMIEGFTLLFYVSYSFLVIKYLHLDLVWAWSTEMFYWIFLFAFSIVYFYKVEWRKSIIKY